MRGPVLAISLSPAGIGLGLQRIGSPETQTGAARDLDLLTIPGADGHSAALLPAIDALLTSCAIAANQLGAIAFDAGPGGFTRVRVACSVAQGIALGIDRPVAAVDSLQMLALAACLQVPSLASGPIAVAVDARMAECYVGVYQASGRPDQPLLSLQVAQLLRAADLQAWLAQAGSAEQPLAMVCGDAVSALSGDAGNATSLPAGAIDLGVPNSRYQLEAMFLLAGSSAAPFQAPENAQPLYVRNKVALDIDEQAALRRDKSPS